MTRLRLVPVVRAMTPREARKNSLALLSVAIDVRRCLHWNPRLRLLLSEAKGRP